MYSKNNLPKTIKKGAYVINLDEYENMGTHWVALFVKPKYTVYFDSFGIEHIPKEIKHTIGNKEIKANIFTIQAYDSIMCGYYCIEFINYMHKPVIKKFNERKVYSQFKDNIWGVDLTDMQSLSKKNKGIKYLLCAIDLYSTHLLFH